MLAASRFGVVSYLTSKLVLCDAHKAANKRKMLVQLSRTTASITFIERHGAQV